VACPSLLLRAHANGVFVSEAGLLVSAPLSVQGVDVIAAIDALEGRTMQLEQEAISSCKIITESQAINRSHTAIIAQLQASDIVQAATIAQLQADKAALQTHVDAAEHLLVGSSMLVDAVTALRFNVSAAAGELQRYGLTLQDTQTQLQQANATFSSRLLQVGSVAAASAVAVQTQLAAAQANIISQHPAVPWWHSSLRCRRSMYPPTLRWRSRWHQPERGSLLSAAAMLRSAARFFSCRVTWHRPSPQAAGWPHG